MLKKSIIGLAAVGAVASTSVRDHRVYLIDELSPQASEVILNKIEDVRTSAMPFQSLTLVIDSPGGVANGMDIILRELQRSKVTFNTVTEHFSASAAAVLFTQGEKRTMIKDSKILFHRVRIMVGMFGQIVLTANDIKVFLETGDLPATYEGDAIGAKQFLVSLPKADLQQALADMNKTDNQLIQTLVKNLKMTEKDVVAKLVPIGKDVMLTAEEALKLGVATEIKDL